MSRGNLAALHGARVGSVGVVSEGPGLPRLAQSAAVLHVPSRESTIRRQLLFAAGDSLDSLLVGETMRRLRRQRLFSDAVLHASRCGTGDVDIQLHTRDYWTLRPRAQLRTGSVVSVGVEERNLLGTGRSVAMLGEWSPRGSGAAFTLNDPWLFGSDVAGTLRIASLGGARTVRASLREHEYSVFDPSRAEASVARLRFGDTTASDRALHTLGALVLVARRVGGGTHGVTLLTAGVEFDSALVIGETRRGAAPDEPHARSFLGVDVGFIRRTASFDTVSWVVPGRGFLDVGLGWEADALLGVGRERILGVPVLKADAWLGRVWMPRRGSVVVLDAWSSGYLGRLVDANHVQRLALAWYADAGRGMWGARLTAERLLELDPDRRQLSLMRTADYTAPAMQPYAARAGRALAASVERSVHVHRFTANSVLDAGGFAAASYRWQLPDSIGGQLRAAVLGGRLRLLTANGAISSIRLDVGYPVLLGAPLEKKPFALVTIGTLFDVSRQRDGRRLY